MPSVSIYLTKELYLRLIQSGEEPSKLVQRLLKEYFEREDKKKP